MGSIIRAVLSKWFFIAYFTLGISYFITFPLIVPWIGWQKSLAVTLALMTASGPYTFKEILEPHGFLWMLAWLIHIASWLLIPALISLLITEAKEDIKREQAADTAFGNLLREGMGSSAKGRELREKVDELVRDFLKSGAPNQTALIEHSDGTEAKNRTSVPAVVQQPEASAVSPAKIPRPPQLSKNNSPREQRKETNHESTKPKT